MISPVARGLLTAAALLLSACRVNPGINPTVEREELTPPTPIGGLRGGPALVGATAQQPVAIEIVVQVDTLGRADLSTLQLTGTGTTDANRQVVSDWLRNQRFEPARLNGYPVRGWFRVSAEAKASGVRYD
jgi:hypothetical protein